MRDYREMDRERCRLDSAYAELEKTSATTWDYPSDRYLVVRLDGVKASAIFLKDHLRSPRYEKALKSALTDAYYVLRGWTRGECKNFYLGALMISDEVSFVLNSGNSPDNRRVIKNCTLLAGLLSAAMMKHLEVYQPKRGVLKKSGSPNDRVLCNFDARPLLFDRLESIPDYLYYRWLLASRNAMFKTYRLQMKIPKSVRFSDEDRASIEWCARQVTENDLFNDYQKVSQGFRLFVPDDEDTLREYSVADDGSGDVRKIFAKISAYGRRVSEQGA